MRHQQAWDRMYILLNQYIIENQEIPNTYVIYQCEYLGKWIHVQNCRYKQGILKPDRLTKLKELGVFFGNRYEKLWYDKYIQLVDFIDIYKNPPKIKEKFRNIELGQWLYIQRDNFKKGKLLRNREELLKKINVL